MFGNSPKVTQLVIGRDEVGLGSEDDLIQSPC